MANPTIKIECRIIPPGTDGTSNPRLILAGPIWDEWDMEACVHGEKMRWTCDECDQWFKDHPRMIPGE